LTAYLFSYCADGAVLVYYAPIHPLKGAKNMVKIRMRRTGCRNHAAYRIVAADSRSPRDGKFLEILGWYDTQIKDDNFKLDLERVDYWLKQGAQPSDTVASLIRRARNPELKPHHARKAKPAAKPAQA
jgi:small subunit ribosomal protein S16